MTKLSKHQLIFSFSLSILIFLIVATSCTSTPKDELKPTDVSETSESNAYINTDAIHIEVPQRPRRSFFYEIPEDILGQFEIGSPDSLNTAVTSLRELGLDSTESGKTLLYVASGIMRLAWTLEKKTWENPDNIPNNAYCGAINSADKGIYDSSTGNSDFLTLVLPSLVLLNNSTKTDYFTDSQQSLSLAQKINESSVLVHYLSGVLNRRQNKLDSALEQFRTAYEKSPNTLQIAFSYAESLYLSGQMQLSSEIAERLIITYPNDLNILKLCAKTTFALKRYQNSELYVARVLQQNPSDSEYILFRARILVEENDYIKASSLLDVFARTDTTSRDYLMLRSRIQHDWNKNLRGSVETIEQAVALYPNDAEVLHFAALLSAETGEKIAGKTAGELAKIILATDPENSSALDISIQELIDQKKWDEAYQISKKLISKDNVSLQVRHVHIKICLSLNKTDEAWSIAEALYKNFPNEEIALQSYLEVLYSLNRRTESAALIEQLLPTATSRLKSFLYFRRSFLKNDEQSVLADLRSSLISNPRNEDALYRLYTLYYEKKDFRRAQYYLKQVVAIHPSDEDLLKKNSELDSLLQ